MEKLLTIVVATYNMEDFLSRCLTSITGIEVPSSVDIIVVNDGSSDSSLEIAQDFKKKRPDIINIIDKKNGNYGSCINAALDVAQGKYFRMLDADDYFDAKSFLSFLHDLSETNSDLLISNFNLIGKKGIIPFINKKIPYRQTLDARSFDFQKEGVSSLLAMHAMTYRTDILKSMNLRLQTGISYTDTEYCYYPLNKIRTIEFFDVILYQYDLTRDGQTMSLQSRIRSISHLDKILYGLVYYYESNKNDESESVIHNQELFVIRVSQMLYQTVLIHCKKKPEFNAILTKIDHLLFEKVPSVYKELNKEKKYRIYYILLWRFFHIYNTSILFRTYNKFIDLLLNRHNE
jgi:glycosyltransferase involved in cell wall biosynthesis